MICKACRLAADIAWTADVVEVIDQHGKCRGGTWCDCQHKLPSQVVTKVRPM